MNFFLFGCVAIQYMHIKFYHGLCNAKDFGNDMVERCFLSAKRTYVKSTSGGTEINMMRIVRKYITTRKYNNSTVWYGLGWAVGSKVSCRL